MGADTVSTFPAPSADWGKIAGFAVVFPRTPNRRRHLRRWFRGMLRRRGIDTGMAYGMARTYVRYHAVAGAS